MSSSLKVTSLVAVLLLVSACGASDRIDGDGPVADLADGELEELCEQFHDDACQSSTDDFCVPSCRATCTASGAANLMRNECVAPITVEQVNECAELFGSGDERAFEVCTMGGGCVFDVFDMAC